MSTHVSRVTSKTYRLAMPRPWGPAVRYQYLIATTVQSSDGGTGQGFSWAVQAGAQAITVGDASEIVTKVAQDCAQQGYDPIELGAGGTVSSSWLTVPAMQKNTRDVIV